MKKKKQNLNTKLKRLAFQSDIVIDENGDIHISFLNSDLFNLIDKSSIKGDRDEWDFKSESDEIELDEYESCNLCPHTCGFNRLEKAHPLCGDDKLRVSNFGISFGDEALISKDSGSGVMFLSGCPLTCPSCINPEKVREPGLELTTKEFVEIAKKLYQQGANNIQILSPTVHLPRLRKALLVLKKNNFPIPIIFKSSGYESVSEIRKLRGLIDVYLPDFKPCSSMSWRKSARVKSNFQSNFEEILNEMYNQVGDAITEEGLLIKGIMIRYVESPYISTHENSQIIDYLYKLKEKATISILDNFVILEKLEA